MAGRMLPHASVVHIQRDKVHSCPRHVRPHTEDTARAYTSSRRTHFEPHHEDHTCLFHNRYMKMRTRHPLCYSTYQQDNQYMRMLP